jgi:PPK2 family polyphosphate:nucleotide phosphotransferase
MSSPVDISQFQVSTRQPIDLADWPTRTARLYDSKADYLSRLGEYRAEIGRLQSVLYAHDRYALLLIFQGMDTAGKGGAIKHVMSGINPQGCQVHGFGPPSQQELDHDFLWRTNRCLPERGRIGIFDRSYYEEVLVVRVRPEILAKQRLPAELVRSERLWDERFGDIRNFEDYLYRNGTRTLKFFLHLSRGEQRRRLLARIEDPEKNWKFDLGDLDSRQAWDNYQAAYADCLSQTSTPTAPWFVVPADDKRNTRLIVSAIIGEHMRALPIEFPKVDEQQRKMLKRAKQVLSD